MTPEEIVKALRAHPLPSPIKLYTIRDQSLFEIRNSDGSRAKTNRVAYIYTEFPQTRFALEIPDDANLEKVIGILEKAVKDFQEKLKGPNF